MKLAFIFKAAADAYNTDYPATVGPHMTNTDSGPFMDIVPSISLRENERGAQTGAGWNPTWHTPLDVWTTFTDDDFRLGLNAAQTTLSALSQLTGARVGGGTVNLSRFLPNKTPGQERKRPNTAVSRYVDHAFCSRCRSS
jgi:hypothetical protein